MSEYTEMTDEEIEQLRELIDLQTEQIRLGKKANEQAIKDYLEKTKTGKALAGVGNAAKDVTTGFTKSATAMADSTGNFGALSGAVGGTVKAVSGLMTAMTDIAGEIPFIGGALNAMGDAAIGVATFAFGEVQKGFDTFQELSRTGQIGADGIEGMAKQMRATNMPLATYSKLLNESSEDLGFLSSSALDGGKAFSKVMIDMAGDTGRPLRRLGLSVEEIGETVVDFQVMQRRQGLLNSLTQAQITKGTEEYAKELDLLAKLTGKSRESVQKEREEAMSDSRFRASLSELDADTQKQHMDAVSQITDPTLKRAYMDQLSGFTNSAASVQMEIVGMGQSIRDAQALINSGEGDSTQAVNGMKIMAGEITKVGGVFQQLSKVMESGQGPMGDYAAMTDFAINALKTQGEVSNAQETQMKTLGTQADKLSLAMMDMQEVTSVMNNVFLATPHATLAVSAFADMTNEVVTYVEDTLLGKSSGGSSTDSLANKALTTANNALDAVSPWQEGSKRLGQIAYDLFGDKPIPVGVTKPESAENKAYRLRGNVPLPDPNSVANAEVVSPKTPAPTVAPGLAAASTPKPKPVDRAPIVAKEKELSDRRAEIAERIAGAGFTPTPAEIAETRELIRVMKGVEKQLQMLNTNTQNGLNKVDRTLKNGM